MRADTFIDAHPAKLKYGIREEVNMNAKTINKKERKTVLLETICKGDIFELMHKIYIGIRWQSTVSDMRELVVFNLTDSELQIIDDYTTSRYAVDFIASNADLTTLFRLDSAVH